MSKAIDTRLVTNVDGCARSTAIGEDLTTGVSKIYSIKLSIPDEGISYNLDTLKSKKRDTQANFQCEGEFIGLTKGNQVYEEKTFDITFGDDYNMVVGDGIDPTISRSTLKAVIEGSAWFDGSNRIGGLGTNGTRNIVTSTSSLPHKNILLEDGKLVDPNLKTATGGLTTSANNAVTAYNDTTCTMVEFKYAFGAQSKGDRFPYFLAETCDFNEGSGADYNKYSISGTRYCDPRDIEAYFVEDESDGEAVNGTPLATTDITRIGKVSNGVATGDVYYGEVDTTDSAISTITLTNGTVGDIIVLVGDGTNAGDNNEAFVFLVSATTTATVIDANYNLIQGARAHATKQLAGLVTATSAVVIDASTGTDGYGKVIIGTAGASGSAVPISSKTNASGSGSDAWLWEIRDWQYSSAGWIDYTGVENL